MQKGFTFWLGGKDYFIITEQENRTRKFARKILEKMGYDLRKYPEEIIENTVQEILKRLRKATCEIKALSDGRKYYDIKGENFGGIGSFVDDGETVIMEI